MVGKVGRRVLEYLKEHPKESDKSKIAKETNADRATVAKYYAVHHGQAAPKKAKPKTKPEPDVEDQDVDVDGNDFAEDFPAEEKPKADPDVKAAAEAEEWHWVI